MGFTGLLPNHILEKLDKKDRPAGPAGLTAAECSKAAQVKSEKILHNLCVTYLQEHHGIKVGHAAMNKKSTFTEGWPDLTFVWNGQPCAVELKVGSNTTSAIQDECIAQMKANGWHVAIVRCFQELIEFLKTVSALPRL